jgi:hypothetical protein
MQNGEGGNTAYRKKQILKFISRYLTHRCTKPFLPAYYNKPNSASAGIIALF